MSLSKVHSKTAWVKVTPREGATFELQPPKRSERLVKWKDGGEWALFIEGEFLGSTEETPGLSIGQAIIWANGILLK